MTLASLDVFPQDADRAGRAYGGRDVAPDAGQAACMRDARWTGYLRVELKDRLRST
jgi:hypothetical protein